MVSNGKINVMRAIKTPAISVKRYLGLVLGPSDVSLESIKIVEFGRCSGVTRANVASD